MPADPPESLEVVRPGRRAQLAACRILARLEPGSTWAPSDAADVGEDELEDYLERSA